MIEDEITTFINDDPAFSVFQDKRSTKWGTFRALKACSEMTILTASRTLQGAEIRAALDKSFANLYHDLDGGFIPINWFMPNLPLPSHRRRDAAQKAMSDFYVDIIQRRRAEGRMVSPLISSVPAPLTCLQNERDLMAALCGQKYKDGRVVTDREVAHILTALLMAGQHTSALSAAWTVMYIANNPAAAYDFRLVPIVHGSPYFQRGSVRRTAETFLQPRWNSSFHDVRRNEGTPCSRRYHS